MITTSNLTQKFQKITFFLLLYTLIVILWGAWVRISHSGDGCGDSWPLCHDQFIPNADHSKTWVEFSHRITSGLFGIFIVAIFLYIRRSDFSTLSKKISLWTLIFTITEALLGAKLVLFRLVGSNDSVFRALAMSLHQLNSLLLSGSIALLYFTFRHHQLKPRFKKIFLVFGFILICMTGAWAALSTTLFPSESLLTGLIADLNKNSHWLVQLRISHPIMALTIGSALALYFWYDGIQSQNRRRQFYSYLTAVAVLFALLFGIMTLFALSPLWMKIAHLCLAHMMWVFILQWLYVNNSLD